MGGFPHEFADAELEAACRQRGKPRFERLEWLGDRLLGCAAAQLLYRRHPDRNEAELSRVLLVMVGNKNLARVSRRLGLADENASVRAAADVLEAYLGAVFEDAGFPAVCACVAEIFRAEIEDASSSRWGKSAKMRLNEHIEAGVTMQATYSYEPTREGFKAACHLGGRVTHGEGVSKHESSLAAAAHMLTLLETEKEENSTAVDDA